MAFKQSSELSKKKSKHRRRRESGFEEWGGYMSAKKQKLELQFEENKALELMDKKETKIFKGICIFVNGHTDPPADDLKRLMLIHGGVYHHYHSSKTTHIIASNLPKSKMKLLKSNTFVTANWITDSIKAGKLLSHHNYLLYTPEVADKQQRLDLENYFHKQSSSLLNPGNKAVKRSRLSRNNNKNIPKLQELSGEDFDSDSSIDLEAKALHIKHSTSNQSEIISPKKTSSNMSTSIPDQKQKVSYKDSFHLKTSLSCNEKHSFHENSHKKQNEYRSKSNELIEETLDLDTGAVSEQNIQSIAVHQNSPHKKSSDKDLYQKRSTSNRFKDSSPMKSSSNRNISSAAVTSNCSRVSPMKCSSNVEIPVSTQNQVISDKDSSCIKPSSGTTGKQAFNNKVSKQNSKNCLMNTNSPEKSLNVSYQKHSSSRQDTTSSSNVDISISAAASSHCKSSPLKPFSNSDVSRSAQTKSSINNKPSHLKPLSSINDSSISTNQTSSIKESCLKSSKSADVSVSPQKLSRAMKAGDANFLPEFFNHSRKHHISTSAQELKRYVQFLVENNKEKHFPKRERLRELSRQFPDDSSFTPSDSKAKSKARNIIMHLDMDCFFVSVGLKKHPELRGVPVAVTHSKGKRGGPQEGSDINYEASHYTNESKQKIKGVISGSEAPKTSNPTPKISMYSKEYGSLSEVASCSYEARKAGVRNGLFLGEALRRCPNLQTIPYDFEGYAEVSKQLYDIVASYTLDIEAVSCDELYIDCTELLQDVRLSPHQFSSILRAEIENETGCTASAGIGSNMLLARLATKVAKPNGQHYVNEKDIEYFMKQHKVGDLPGIGYATVEKLRGLNITTCGDLQNWSLAKLQQEFGPKTGQVFYNNCRGKDDKVVQYHKDRKSVSAEVNYGIRFETEEDVYKFINDLSAEVQNRIRNLNCKGNQVTLKLMARKRDAPVETAKFMGHGVCDSYSKSIALKSATDSAQVIAKECCSLARSFKINPQDYRGVGIQLSKLVQNAPSQKGHKTAASVSKQSNSEVVDDMDTRGVFAPKNLTKVNKGISEKSTITHFLANKSSASEVLDNPVEKNPLKNTSPFKQTEASSKYEPKSNTIEHFLSNKPSTSRARSYNITDYLPEELDQSVLEALPEDLKKEILESCKPKSAGRESKLKQNGPTSSAGEQGKSNELMLQEQLSRKYGVNEATSSIQSEVIGLDESFLNALPDDLRKEVLSNYKDISNKQWGHNSVSSSAVQQPSTSSESKPSNSPKKNKIIKNSSKPIPEPNSDKCSIKTKPSLAGAVELDDVRALIKEWIESTDDPLPEDVNDLKNFLVELCDVELCNVEILAKYLYRMAKKANQKWKDTYLTVLSSVQKKVFSQYNSTLELSSEFQT